MKRIDHVAYVACVLLGACAVCCSAPAAQGPPAPDYSQERSWAAWPGRASGADAVVPGISEHSAASPGQVDVFFIHPTTYLTGRVGNARYDEPGLTYLMIDRGVLRSQASAFNECCRIYAPRYRQAALAAFFHRDAAADSAALDLAYGDVLRAFDYYLQHENHGRPFIIAGHSQGSLHALRLVQERVAGRPIQQRMVAAYIVGYSVPQEIVRTGVPICTSASQTGCIVSWNTIKPSAANQSRSAQLIWLDGSYQRLGERKPVCVNPLTWTPDSGASSDANLGALPGVKPNEDLRPIVPGLTGADCMNGELTVSIPIAARRGFADGLTLLGSYHIYDYNLFYENIRVNADQRTAAFLAQTPSAGADEHRPGGP